MLLLHTFYTLFAHFMASFIKSKSGKLRVFVTINYKRYSKTVKNRAEGNAWEAQLLLSSDVKTVNKTFGELLENYRDKVSANKKGERWERIRIARFLLEPLAKKQIGNLTKLDFADWRDNRMKQVSNLTVLREWALLNHAFEIAIREWEWLTVNPMKGLKKPIGEPPRDRLITDDEITHLCAALNYALDEKPIQVISRVGAAFVFAIETGLRAQELCNLNWADVKGRVIKINASKTRAGVREVPLSAKAQAILAQMRGLDENSVFNLRTSQIDSLFRKAKSQCLIENLHFHDSRHLAITRLATKLNVLELARCVGHKDLRLLMIYYNESVEKIANKLN